MPLRRRKGRRCQGGERSSALRIFNGILCLLMLLFAAVQYNDPDGPLWAAIYAVPAIWCGLLAWRPSLPAEHAPLHYLLLASLGAAVLLTVYFWPRAESFWRIDIWWDDEGAREGMGMMIVTAALAAAAYGAARIRRARQTF